MAGYREHVTVSGLLGVAYGAAAMFMFGYSLVQASIAVVLTWISGMLPDLDSESGKPIRELFGVTAALVPILLIQHVHSIGVSGDRAMLFSLVSYGLVRFGGAFLLAKLTVHRGMFHSIPALLIAAELTFLCYHTDELHVRMLMAVGVGLGFFSHLLLDEVYSVQWDGAKVKLAKSSGSALKFFGNDAVPNGVAMGLLLCLSYATLVEAEIVRDPGSTPAPDTVRITADLPDAPPFLVAEEPRDTQFR